MDEKTLFMTFWKKEAKATRKVLERIPEGATYRPDPKSRPAREIAWQIVYEEIQLADGLVKDQSSGRIRRRPRRCAKCSRPTTGTIQS
jgi:hypothetical protein